MFNKILVATDGSEHSQKAVKVASDLATKYDSELFLVHVQMDGPVPDQLRHMLEVEHLVDSPHGQRPDPANIAANWAAARSGGVSTDASFRLFEALGRGLLERAKRVAIDKGANKVSTHLIEGEPVRAILAFASLHQVDLIVVGTRGLSDLKGLLMGSVSHKLGQLAKVTCITVK